MANPTNAAELSRNVLMYQYHAALHRDKMLGYNCSSLHESFVIKLAIMIVPV